MKKNECAWFSKVIGVPDTYQERLFDDPSRRTMVNKSRRTGISTILAFKALRRAILGKDCLIVSASERQSIAVMTNYVEHFLKALPMRLPLVEDSKSVKRFANDGAIRSLPNQSNTIRGLNADYIFLDEAAHFLNGTDEAVWEAVSPMLALGGTIDIASTPFGDKNLFARMWRDPNNGFEKTTINWRDCPRLTPEIEAIRKTEDAITFDQEFNNVFRGEVMSEFPMSLLETCVDSEMRYEMNAQGDVAGADIGRRRDLSAYVIVRRMPDGTKLVVEKDSWAGVPLPEQEERFVAIAKRVGEFRFDQGGMGEQMGDSIPRRCPNAVPVLFTHENKTEMWLSLKRDIEQRRVRYPFDARLLASLNSVRRYFRVGRVIMDAERTDETGHADEATALALACWELGGRGATAIIPETDPDLGFDPW